MKKLKEQMIRLKLSPRAEITKLLSIILVILVGTFLCSYFIKSWLYLSIGAGLSLIIIVFYLSRYGTMIDRINKDNLDEFINLFSYFRIYIHNGYNVYTALKEISFFANQDLRELLEILLNEIDEDKSVRPFIKFSKNFNEILVEEMMISIYQMIDDGEQSNYLQQFEMIFDKFSDVTAEKNLKAKDSSLGTLSSAPLVGSCFLIIMITIGIIGVLGDLMNVI